MSFEGGFQGRTNKLVDSCYSFWQAAIFPLVQYALGITPTKMREMNGGEADEYHVHSWLFDQEALQKYILLACQDYDGGIKDKPGKSRDYYHTCYALSGLAIAQHDDLDTNVANINIELPTHICEFGLFQNLVEIIHPVYNVRPERVARAKEYFSKFELPSHTP
jgi:protein farnesyltransferase subunit beta